MLNSFLFIIGLIGLLVGIIFTPTPIPGTTPLIIASAALLVHTSHRTEKLVKFIRSRYAWLDKIFTKLEELVPSKPKKIGETLKKTRPSK